MSRAVHVPRLAPVAAAALIAAGPLAAQVRPPATSPGHPPRTVAQQWEQVQRLADAHRWAEALAVARPLAKDSAGRVAVARLAANAGLEAMQAADTALARSRWELTVQDDPTLVRPASDLAALYLMDGALDSTRAVATRALRFAPTDPRLLAIRQQSLTTRAQLDSAIAADRRSRHRDPQDDGVSLDLAGLLARKGDAAATVALYDTLLTTPSPSEAVYEAGAQFAFRLHDYHRAATLADTAVARYPRSSTLWALEASADSAQGAWPAAARAYERAAAISAEPWALDLALLHADAQAGDTAAAARVLRDMARRRAPTSSLLTAADRVEALGRAQAADSVYRTVLRDAPDEVTALDASAAIAERTGDTVRAVTLYRREAAIDSSGPEAPMGLLRLTQPGSDEARRLLLLAEWRGLSQWQWAQMTVLAAAQSGGGPAVATVAAPAARRAQALTRVLRTVLDTIVFHTDWGPAELVRAERQYPQNLLLARYAARLAAARGRDSLALADYDALLRIKADDASLQRSRAAVLLHMGREGEAARGYARALELEPTNDTTYRALLALDERRGSLDDLLAQMRLLRVRYPKLRPLAEDEIELLQRLGRLDEAAAAARNLNRSTRDTTSRHGPGAS